MEYFLLKTCKKSGLEWKQYNSLDKCPCNECKKPVDLSLKKVYKPPKKQSKKQSVLNAKYSVIRIEFLSKPENQICPVTKKMATEVHHKKGRKGFADQWARDNNIPLLIDVRFFLGVSRYGHEKIENNPEWAKENGYSLNRI